MRMRIRCFVGSNSGLSFVKVRMGSVGCAFSEALGHEGMMYVMKRRLTPLIDKTMKPNASCCVHKYGVAAKFVPEGYHYR